ncbi:hypothetical protein MNBD_GAMMA11-3434 [hydrothermal vent metagenome]|uniref:Outer membrane protein beta-barrel domain-containing protein n=1 Tax=hydrothermal vent metagenome TaxID=652676 RepID=A0A3B0X3R0_9ZZZZ
MKKNNMIASLFLLLISATGFIQPLAAEQRLVVGAKVLGAGWGGDNANGSTFNSDNGGQLGLNIAYQLGKFYTGLNLQGGNYDFTGTAPSQFTGSGSVSVGSDRIRQTEIDLLVGYYIWPQISLFVDIKAVENKWQSNNYKQNFGGLGLGITGFNPLNKNWTLFGSLGFVTGDIEDGGKNRVGDGSSSALEVGVVYTLSKNNHLNFGFKFRSYDFKSNNGEQQNYDINALFVGYSHAFQLN